MALNIKVFKMNFDFEYTQINSITPINGITLSLGELMII